MSRGDHCFVWRFDCVVPYQHHAIDLGDGDVVHYTGDGVTARPWAALAEQTVQRTGLDRLTRGGKDKLHVVRRSTAETEDEVVRRALSQLGRPGYCVVFRNCEHFAHWAATGNWASRQVDVFVERSGAIVTKTAIGWGQRIFGKGILAKSLLGRGLSGRWHPASLIGDAAQFAAESLGQHVGMRDPVVRRRVGRGLNLATSVGCGAVAGPVGMLAAGGSWAAGELSGLGCRLAVERLKKDVGE